MTGSHRDFRHALNKYALLRLAQVAKNAVCANAHQIEARLARRILMMQDRFHSNELPATHESLAKMLGVRRSSVTVIAVHVSAKEPYSIQQRRAYSSRSKGAGNPLLRMLLDGRSLGIGELNRMLIGETDAATTPFMSPMATTRFSAARPAQLEMDRPNLAVRAFSRTAPPPVAESSSHAQRTSA